MALDQRVMASILRYYPSYFPSLPKSDQGTGLGLYISKSIIEAHGGKIWAKNNPRRNGATFSFSPVKSTNNKSISVNN